MTTANKITMVRILMIPFFIYFALQYDKTSLIIALVLFCLASVTDFIDGYIARKYNQITDFGKFVDPLADKLLVTAALLIFIEKGIFPAWMVFIVLAREFIITSLRNVAAAKGKVLAASWTGKVKTCVQIAGIIIDFFVLIIISNRDINELLSSQFVPHDGLNPILVTNIVAWVVTLVTIYSGIDYMLKNWDLVKDGAVKKN